MSSPFTTLEEFNAALDGPTGGAIYTFAQNPAINIIALLVAVGIFVWFMTTTYTTHAMPSNSTDNPVDKSLSHLSTFIVVGLLSFVAATQQHFVRHPSANQTARQSLTQSPTQSLTQRKSFQQASRQLPIGLLGMVGAGLPRLRRISRNNSGKRASAYFSRKRRSRW